MLILLHGLVPRQESPAPVGCYEFDRAYFRWPDFSAQGAAPRTRILRLLAIPHRSIGTVENRLFEVVPVPFEVHPVTAKQFRESSFWMTSDRGILEIKWSQAAGGDMFQFSTIGDTLRGKYWYVDLFGSKGSEEDASAVRITCPP